MPVRDDSKEQLLEAGVQLLTSGAVVGVQKLLTPEALEEKSRDSNRHGVSRHTAYRLWENRDMAVTEIARHVVGRNASQAWSNFVDEITQKVDKLWEAETRIVELRSRAVSGKDWKAEHASRWSNDLGYAELRQAYRNISEDSVRRDLESDEVAASWALHCAAISSSFPWGGAEPSDGQAEMGRRILAARADTYASAAMLWADALDSLLAWWGRSLRPGCDIWSLVRRMSGMHDGLVLQLFADPIFYDKRRSEAEREEAVDARITFICDALFDLIWSNTEEGRDDPRRRRLLTEEMVSFDTVVDAAMDIYWFAPGASVGITTAAYRASIDFDLARRLFPSPGDLADSVLRRLVAPAGIYLRLSQHVNPAPLVALVLRRLHQVTVRHPGLFHVLDICAPTPPAGEQVFLDELQVAIAEALAADTVVCPTPERTARLLLQLTLDGEGEWDDVASVLALLADS